MPQISLPTLLWLLFAGTRLCLAQPNDPRIHDIRIACQRMEVQRATYDVTLDDRTEDCQIAWFSKGDTIALIEIIRFSTTHKKSATYYFDNGKLVFACEKAVAYPAATVTQQDSFYFFQDTLIGYTVSDQVAYNQTFGPDSGIGQRMAAAAGQRRLEEAYALMAGARR